MTNEDSQDKKPSLSISTLLDRMHPKNCLGLEFESDLPLEDQIASIVRDFDDDSTKKRTEALQRLYDLTDVSHKENRVPLVGKIDLGVIPGLLKFVAPNSTSEDRRLACLILNNLSIPFDNKNVFIFGTDSDGLLQSLLTVMKEGLPESYLCCICLMNLSVGSDAQLKLIRYKTNQQPFLRIVELLMKTYEPLWRKASSQSKMSTQGLALRWATGLVRNLTSTKEGASVIANTTEIPAVVVSVLKHSSRPLTKWTEDSLEDLALLVLVQLAKWPESAKSLKNLPTREALTPIIGQGGIHDVRASMVECSLDPS